MTENETTTTERPALGDIKAGDRVFVLRSSNDMRGRSPADRSIPAEVVKAARVWITVRLIGKYPLELRFRRDNQSDGSIYSGSSEHFATPEQQAWAEALHVADAYLSQQGIDVGYGSGRKWGSPERRIRLAQIIRNAETER